MSAPSRSRPIPGSLPPLPLAPSPLARPPARQGPAPVAAEVRPARSSGATGTAKVALLLSGLIAVAGVSFSIGRLTADGSQAGPQSAFGAGPAAFGGTDRNVADDVVTTGAPDGGVSSGTEPNDTVAALTAAEPASEDTAISVTELSVASDRAVGSGLRDSAPQSSDGTAGPATGGALGGPPGGGAGRGGIEGTIAELSESELMLTLADGNTRSVALDTTTTWVEQQPITVADVAVGDTVSVELPFGGFGAAEDEAASTVATQVTVTSTAS